MRIYNNSPKLLQSRDMHVVSERDTFIAFCVGQSADRSSVEGFKAPKSACMQACLSASHSAWRIGADTRRLESLSTGMHRHAISRLLPSVVRTQPARQFGLVAIRCQSTQTGEPKATPALLDKLKDKDLLKVHGFIGGQWVSASDGTIMEVTVFLANIQHALLRSQRPSNPGTCVKCIS